MKPGEYWELSFSELHAMVAAWELNHQRFIDPLRWLGHLVYPLTHKESKTPAQLWPLPDLDQGKDPAAKSSKKWKIDKKEVENFEAWLKRKNESEAED